VAPASEQVPWVLVDARYVTLDGRVSVTVTFVAEAGPLFVTVSVYSSGVPSVTGFGVAVLTIATSALFASATITVALAELLVRPGTMFEAVAVSVSVMLVPEGVPALTCSTRLKLAVALTARFAIVHVIVPVPPTGGTVPQAQPAGGVIERKFVFGGVTCVKLTVVAAAVPRFFTVCV
jgi:hypothetical protein